MTQPGEAGGSTVRGGYQLKTLRDLGMCSYIPVTMHADMVQAEAYLVQIDNGRHKPPKS